MADPAIPAADQLSAATSGDETKLFVSLDGQAWTEIGEITDMPDLPSGQQSTYETTHMSSGKFKEFKKNKRIEGSETDIEGNLTLVDDTVADAPLAVLRTIEERVDAVPVRIDLKQGGDTFHVTSVALFYTLRLSNPMEDVRKFTITAKWVADYTITKAA